MPLHHFFALAVLCFQLLCAAQSAVFVPSTPARALREAMAYLGLADMQQLKPVNVYQKAFIDRYLSDDLGSDAVDMISGFSSQELRAWASADIDELNRLLEEEGFAIRLVQTSPAEFGVVAILKAAIEWRREALKTHVMHQGVEYPAIKLEHTKHGCTVMQIAGYDYPVAAVKTKSQDTVYFAVADAPATGAELQNKLVALLKNEQQLATDYSSVVVPMVSLDIQEKLDWLVGLKLGEGASVSQALQQTKFNMDVSGARVENAVALTVKGCMPSPEYVIDQSFFVCIVRQGMSEPYFSAYVTPQDWRKP